MLTPKQISSETLELVNVTLYGEVFADMMNSVI